MHSSTKRLIAFTPSAGMNIFRKLMFSEPEPFGQAVQAQRIGRERFGARHELVVHDRQVAAGVGQGVRARDRVHGIGTQRVFERGALGARS